MSNPRPIVKVENRGWRSWPSDIRAARYDIKPSGHTRQSCLIGSNNFVLGSDYPHAPSTFPNTLSGLMDIEGLSDEAKEDIAGGNLKRLFDL
ncbi:MAG: amidohydrolase family protein [Rhodospirillales bacterium]